MEESLSYRIISLGECSGSSGHLGKSKRKAALKVTSANVCVDCIALEAH